MRGESGGAFIFVYRSGCCNGGGGGDGGSFPHYSPVSRGVCYHHLSCSQRIYIIT